MVYGTRPEAVKLSPLVPLLPDAVVIHTGQHQTLAEGILAPTIRMQHPSPNDPEAYVDSLTIALKPRLRGMDLVVVQGDTASAYAGAFTASQLGIQVAHVEAGIRSGDLHDPWPEEGFRVGIDKLSSLAFCATEGNARNLQAMSFTGNIHVTGNTGIDALYQHTHPVKHPYHPQPRVLVTLHRRESFGAPLSQILHGLLQACQQFPTIDFLWPVHPNPKVREAIPNQLPRNLHLLPPLDPRVFQNLLASSRAVLTDSGGVQEEAAALGTPCVIARKHTDRPESVENFHAILAGTSGIRLGLHKALTYQLSSAPSLCFGDGHAAPRISEVLLNL